MIQRIAALVAVLVIGLAPAGAQSPVIDGLLDADFYGSARGVQDTPTSFGDATNGHTRVAIGGSELDAVYARVSDGALFLFVAGNVETAGQGLEFPAGNRNRLDLFIDSTAGGQNSLRGDNADVDGNGLNRMGHLDPANDGLKFDTGMEPDFFLTFYNYTAVQDFGPGYGLREVWRGPSWKARPCPRTAAAPPCPSASPRTHSRVRIPHSSICRTACGWGFRTAIPVA